MFLNSVRLAGWRWLLPVGAGTAVRPIGSGALSLRRARPAASELVIRWPPAGRMLGAQRGDLVLEVSQ